LRDDFFYRLCSDVVEIPSLTQRIQEDPAELEDLLEHTVNRILGTSSKELVHLLADTIKRDLGLDYQWPGNVRELEQCVRRILLNRRYDPLQSNTPSDPAEKLHAKVAEGSLDAHGLVTSYCYCLYLRLGTYEAVAKRVALDRRTAKKYILEGKKYVG
jgi:transcriptional regulator with PAS, ATPase and Fis domain